MQEKDRFGEYKGIPFTDLDPIYLTCYTNSPQTHGYWTLFGCKKSLRCLPPKMTRLDLTGGTRWAPPVINELTNPHKMAENKWVTVVISPYL